LIRSTDARKIGGKIYLSKSTDLSFLSFSDHSFQYLYKDTNTMPLATSPLIQSLSDFYSQSSFENSSKNWQQEVEVTIYSHNQDNVFLWN